MMTYHVPILLKEAVEGLVRDREGIYVDGTTGGGGHSEGIAKRLLGNGKLICLDQDSEALAEAGQRLRPFSERVKLVKANFRDLAEVLDGLGIEKADGILLDIGVSSHQLDAGERGFSYQADAPLDMRMDRQQSFSAYDVVNGYSETELLRVIRDYGEEKWAARIAKFIVEARKGGPLESTGQLVDVIKAAIPASARREGPHPAKRTFQAIRIEVNDELGALQDGLERGVERLRPGGRMAVITFHSLEDRMVKQTFRRLADPCTCPKSFPVCVCGKKPQVEIVTRKPIQPSSEEIEGNPRARSAKLRIAQRLCSNT
ncbi:16S rRNA (cytosine(1402)-N(4))-methyltransferase RsmH [Christensenellaceae bacterium NSJ-53]|uniref:Ribosomal RNA small subunit methyltransferase H n=2 Tax=Gehongia tenuis TaxID=2763655 RepID=A0A926D410_9FIRM|nr:16S rRNA (cytosine(1402)-N(4))-methyltransferase RsmH [Gehongia tenuis]MBC8530846.1 16S rRNA (cytosine(1402)-N(4))-methyltransferase RsmH [Gehongia tenuis]